MVIPAPAARWSRSEGDDWDIVTSVGYTALAVAAERAVETKRADSLIQDKFAEQFVIAAAVPNLVRYIVTPRPANPGMARFSRHMGVRSRFFDEFFLDAAAAGIRQSVILAAGLDARAHRLDWPAGQIVFELDRPLVLSFKNAILEKSSVAPRSDRRAVAVDLRDDWPSALRAAGFDPTTPCAWSAEGLLSYLPSAARQLLFERIESLSPPGSRIAVQSHHRAFNASETHEKMKEVDPYHPLAQIDLSDLVFPDQQFDSQVWLEQHGWAVDVRTASQLGMGYGLVCEEPGPIEDTSIYISATLPAVP